MNRRHVIWSLVGLVVAGVVLGLGVQPGQASGVVGNGTPGSCTEGNLDSALQLGGLVTFNCGPQPITITVQEKTIGLPTTINGGSLVTLSGDFNNRVFSVTVGVSLTLNNLRVTRGQTYEAGGGGGIYNAGSLVLNHSRLDLNICESPCPGGSAIMNAGALEVYDSVVTGNATRYGGAIHDIGAGSANIISSTISANYSTELFATTGAGLSHAAVSGIVLLLNSSVISNTSASSAAGLYNAGIMIIVNSTLSGNAADAYAGGLLNAGYMTVRSSTITNNYADSNLDGVGDGGGIYNSGSFTFTNTLLAGNWESFFFSGGFWIPHVGECTGTLDSGGYNQLENYNTSRCFFNGSISLIADPLLGPVQDNGGPAPTHALLPGSPALNAGNPLGCTNERNDPLLVDERGWARVDRCDVGAFELGPRVLLPLVER